MTALPAATDFTGASITEAQFKTAITNQRAFLSELLGTTGAASVARPLLQVPTSRDIGSSINLNTVVESGMYRLGVSLTNAPAGADYGQMLVVHGGSDTIAQIVFPYVTAGSMYVRQGNPSDVGGAGSWSAWTKMATEAFVNSAISTATASLALSANYGQATANGTQVKEITGIPSWVRRITLISSDLSGTYTTSALAYLELGDSGGFETNTDKAFAVSAGAADCNFFAQLVRIPGTNTWVFRVTMFNTYHESTYSDTQTTSAATDRIRVRLAYGNFDAGTLTAYYE